jgi:hypothetical protein
MLAALQSAQKKFFQLTWRKLDDTSHLEKQIFPGVYGLSLNVEKPKVELDHILYIGMTLGALRRRITQFRNGLEKPKGGNHIAAEHFVQRNGSPFSEKFPGRAFYFIALPITRLDVPPSLRRYYIRTLENYLILSVIELIGKKPQLNQD